MLHYSNISISLAGSFTHTHTHTHTRTHTHREKFIGIVFERSILHVHVYLKAKLRGNTAKTVNQVAETVPSLSRNSNSIPQVFNQN